VPKLAVLDQHARSSSLRGVLWKNLSVTEPLMMPPPKDPGSRVAKRSTSWGNPEIDATRVGRRLGVGLRGAAAFECIANQLLAELIRTAQIAAATTARSGARAEKKDVNPSNIEACVLGMPTLPEPGRRTPSAAPALAIACGADQR
jgi:hypothetical protein